MQGRVKLHRKIQSNPICENLEVLGFFSYLLIKANHKEKIILIWLQKITIEPWQFISSIRKLADKFQVSRGKIERMVKLLVELKILRHKWYTKYSLFTVLNRDKYQGSETQVEQQVEPQVEHKQEWYKNEKEIDTKFSFDDFRLQYPLKEWKSKAMELYKKKIKTQADHDELIKGLQWYIAVVKAKTTKTFIHPYKQGSAFMNQETRKDYLDWEVLQSVQANIPLDKLYANYIADEREPDEKWAEYCAKYGKDFMRKAQIAYSDSQVVDLVL